MCSITRTYLIKVLCTNLGTNLYKLKFLISSALLLASMPISMGAIAVIDTTGRLAAAGVLLPATILVAKSLHDPDESEDE